MGPNDPFEPISMWYGVSWGLNSCRLFKKKKRVPGKNTQAPTVRIRSSCLGLRQAATISLTA